MRSALRDELQQCLAGVFEITRELGGGGMSCVFEATETALKRRVVIKVLSPDLDGELNVERFQREIHLAARLHHPHIVAILSAGLCGVLPFYTMPFIDGESLRNRLQRGPLSIGDCIDMMRDVARALVFAHERGVVHRDIKPDNVMLSGGSAIVTDFGIAKALAESCTPSARSSILTQQGTALGTPAYMAPEQIACDSVDHRADIYAFGATAYEALTGAPPFGIGPAASLLVAHLIDRPPSLFDARPDVPIGLERLIIQCLEKDPAHRPACAADMLAALDALARSDPSVGPHPVATHRVSIGVLPFANMSADRNNDYLSDGITEELMTALARLPGLRVAARASSFAFRGNTLDPQVIGARLRVETLLTGNVRKSENRLRIGAELVRAVDATALWSERFDRESADIFDIQDEITTAIVEALRLPLMGDSQVDSRLRHTSDVAAYTLYLKGRHFFNSRTEPGLWRSLECYKQAIELDPEYALAYCGIADSCGILALFMALPPTEARSRMFEASERALALDPSLGEAHVSVATYELWFGWDLDRSERHFRRALQLDPRLVMASVWMGQLLVQRGQISTGIAAATRGMSLEPLSPVVNTGAAFVYHLAGRHEEAIRILEGVLELDPGRPTTLWVLGWCQLGLGDTGAAVLSIESAIAAVQRNPWWLCSLAFAYAEDGQVERSQALLEELTLPNQTRHVPRALLARAFLALGDRDRAFRLSMEALESHEMSAWGVLTHPGWRALHDHPDRDKLAAAAPTHIS